MGDIRDTPSIFTCTRFILTEFDHFTRLPKPNTTFPRDTSHRFQRTNYLLYSG